MLPIFKACADETRLRILGILEKGDCNVNELVDILQMGQSRISRHLKILADSKLVSSRREGNWIYYRLASVNGDSNLNDAIRLAIKGAVALPTYKSDLQHVESVMQRRRSISQQYFEKVGPDWEQLQNEVLNSEFYREAAFALLPERAETAVDLGVGAGLILPRLLKSFDRVIAVDSSQRMLKIASDYVQQQVPAAHAKCSFRLGELDHLPIHDRTVDAAIALMVFHHVPKPIAAIQEIYRILKPGATFVFADLLEHNIEKMREKYADLWLGFKKADITKWMHQAGFVVKSTEILKNEKMMQVLLNKAIKPISA